MRWCLRHHPMWQFWYSNWLENHHCLPCLGKVCHFLGSSSHPLLCSNCYIIIMQHNKDSPKDLDTIPEVTLFTGWFESLLWTSTLAFLNRIISGIVSKMFGEFYNFTPTILVAYLCSLAHLQSFHSTIPPISLQSHPRRKLSYQPLLVNISCISLYSGQSRFTQYLYLLSHSWEFPSVSLHSKWRIFISCLPFS